MKISIIAPMYNEELNVENTFNKIKAEMGKNSYDWELIFVNDGSTDNTFNVAVELEGRENRLKVVGYNVNQGRGKAIRTGFAYSTGDIIITIDFDLSYDVTHITRMNQTLENDSMVDVVLVSAYMPGGKVIGVSPRRLFLSKGGNVILKNSFSQKIYTSTCVVRAYRKHVIQSLFLESDDKEIHLEILSKILSLGYKIKEIPGTLTSRKSGKSKSTIITTVLSHLKFFAFEKPFFIFGFIGIILMLTGFVFGLLLTYIRFVSELYLGGLERIFSPNMVMVLLFVGLLLIAFGFLGIQINIIKKEIYKLQSIVREQKR